MPLPKPTPNTLPVELLADIFLRWESIDKDGPWTASAVCKYWRHVVLGCPRVWCNVTYELRMISPPKSPWHLQDRKYAGEELCDNGAEDTSDSGEASGVEDVDADDGQRQDEPAPLRRYEEEEEEEDVIYGTEDPEQDEATITKLLCVRRRPFHIWIERTGGVDFSLDIYIEERYPKLAFQLISDLRALRGHLHCLRKLSISTEETPLTQDLLGFFLEMESQQSLPMRLQDFQVVIRGDRIRLDGDAPNFSLNPDALVRFWADFRVSHSLTFDGCAPRFHHQTFHDGDFDPSTLRHLTLRRIPPDVEAFQESSNPESAEHRFEGVAQPSLCIGLLPTLDAPNLTFFSLRNSSFEDLERALKDGIAPYAAMTDLGVALARFAQSAPNIATFHLAKSPVHDRHFLEVLASWRDLRELALTELLIGPLAMRGLAASPTGATSQSVPLCPDLRVLRIEKCDLIRGDHLVSLVRSRNGPRAPTVPLDSLDVICCENITPTHIAQIRRVDPFHLSLVAVHE